MTINTTPALDVSTGTVISQDGSTIAYQTVGRGPKVIVIPGALSTAADYAAFSIALGEHFTVHTIERRGRGLSSPQGPNYSLAKEREDLLALQQATGATLLVGHSFGGLVALETARNTHLFQKVAVYEPGVSIDGSINMDWMPAYERLLSQGKTLSAFIEFVRGTGPDFIRTIPRWYLKLLMPLFLKAHERQQMFPLLWQNLCEHKEVARYDNSSQNYHEITAAVLHMTGGKTGSRWVEMQSARLASVIPHFQTQQFPKLDHFGINQKDPQAVAAAVNAFFQK